MIPCESTHWEMSVHTFDPPSVPAGEATVVIVEGAANGPFWNATKYW